MAKKHWTQTAAGRKRLSEQGKTWWRKKAKLRKNTHHKEAADGPTEAQVAYGFGHCEAFIQDLATRSGVPFKALAQRVGILLQYGEGR